MTPTTSGPLTGILIFQPSNNTKALSISGNAAAGLNGTIYAPTAQLSITGNGNFTETIIVDRLILSGNGSNLGSVGQPLASFSDNIVLPVKGQLNRTSPSVLCTLQLFAEKLEENQARDRLFAGFNVGPAKPLVRSTILASKAQSDATQKHDPFEADLLEEDLLVSIVLAQLAAKLKSDATA